MKILMITPYVTITSRPEFSRNKTGFGYMVMDIASSVAKSEQVGVLASDSRGNAFVKDSVHFLKRSFGLIGLNLKNCLSLRLTYQLWYQYHMECGTFVRLLYHWFLTGYYSQVIKTGRYDVVHIHGCNFATELWVQVCKQYGQKFVITLHGLNSFSDTVRLESAGKRYERDFLQRVVQGEFPITVISTGMKHTIEKTYGIQNCSNITVVCNSFSFSESDVSIKRNFKLRTSQDNTSKSIREQYYIPKSAKLLLYVGNISRNKNQTQMVRAFALLPKELKENTFVLFCGKENNTIVNLQEQINTSGYATHLVVCGGIDREQMARYYQEADGVVLLSISEGFGLSLIEGLHFGLPVMSFTDVDAFEDIYHENVMVGVEEHTDNAVAKGVETLLGKVWDKATIREYSKKFESQNMAKQYVDVYQRLV